MRISFKTMASKKATTWRLKNPESNNKLLSKVMSYSYYTEWKHSSKQVVAITYTLDKRVSAAATFKGLWVVFFWIKSKNVSYTLVCFSFFYISRSKKTKEKLLVRDKLNFLYVNVLFDMTKSKLRFHLFLWQT